MCCRYYCDSEDVKERLETLGIGMPGGIGVPGGEIAPGRTALMITGGHDRPLAALAAWGFPGRNESLVINARAETAPEKPMFRSAMETRRCLLPATWFYEWDHDKNRATFSPMDQPVIYLAGLWSRFGSESRFVVLTTAANESMLPVHDRMPLMVDPGNLEAWLFDPGFALAFLHAGMPQLRVRREYEQLRFL